MELQRDLDELADVRLVVHDEHLGDLVIVCHGAPGSFSRACRPPWTPAGTVSAPGAGGYEPEAGLGAGLGELGEESGLITISLAS